MWWQCEWFIWCWYANQQSPKWDCISRLPEWDWLWTAANHLSLWKIPHDLCFSAAECGIMTVSVGTVWNSKWELETSSVSGKRSSACRFSFTCAASILIPPVPLSAPTSRVLRQSGERLLFLLMLVTTFKYIQLKMLPCFFPPHKSHWSNLLQCDMAS